MLWRLLLAAYCCSTAASSQQIRPQYIWVELGPPADRKQAFQILARYAGAEGGQCPNILLDGKGRRMIRRPPTGTFGALICETVVPLAVRSASIRGQSLPLPKWGKRAKPNVVVVGDTGCRIKKGSDDPAQTGARAQWNVQNCASPKDWPFEEVARSAANTKPDLVIHVGDYLYREKSCTGVKGCPGGPAGDTLETWAADFFIPAQALLRAAPWIFVRGNHETCERSGNGWFSLLEPRAAPVCKDYSDPYLIQAGKLPLVVVDDSTATDALCPAGDAACNAQFDIEVEKYADQFGIVAGWNLEGAWLLSHRPVWSVKGGRAGLEMLNAVLETAWDRARPTGVDLLLAGHTHTFELVGFTPESGRVTQLVIGNSGTKLVPRFKFDGQSAVAQRAGIQNFRDVQDFGFTTLSPGEDTWKIEAHDRTGTVQFACALPFTAERCGR
ncbi:MAG: metallophosphoesterase [Acidobacteriota bacterium]|nr:metallophosphoesterase [Acidobacteriota bacterium]